MQQANIKVESRTIQNHRKDVLETPFPVVSTAVRYQPMSANGRPIGRSLKWTFTTVGRAGHFAPIAAVKSSCGAARKPPSGVLIC